MLRIDIWPEAKDFLETLSAKRKRQVSVKILLLAEYPMPARSKILEGYAPLRRLRSGDYRIVYFVESNILKIPLIDKRGDDEVYRRLKRLFG
ncbi:MAG: type II toxin-antitoxin system RelE/ParE family toxin [bacterium]|nr:type II toxin-antitoxin system RelE/ParE family toxin [bacterium]